MLLYLRTQFTQRYSSLPLFYPAILQCQFTNQIKNKCHIKDPDYASDLRHSFLRRKQFCLSIISYVIIVLYEIIILLSHNVNLLTYIYVL